MTRSNRRGSLALALAAAALLSCVARACGSAIPMWEFLTREEKLSHLYHIFSQEVSQFCADSSMPDCNKNLLIAGLKKLANLEDDRLDEMDPYQRGAKDIIWRAVVGNNRQTASRLGQHSFHTSEDDPLAVGENELAQESVAREEYVEPGEQPAGPYLVGPMVIRVYPDGRPVASDAARPLPRDEDMEDMRRDTRLPSVKELEAPSRPARQMLPPRRHGPRARRHPLAPLNLLVRERLY